MAVILLDCNRQPFRDPNHIVVMPNVITSPGYRIILEEMKKQKKDRETRSCDHKIKI